MGWRLLGSTITFHSGSGDAEVGRNNPYFCGLYEEIARLLAEGGAALFGFEGREHTAQVEAKLREIREARFRFGPDDRKTLEEEADLLKELGEDGRFLPTLFCSRPMELGVDISAMNASTCATCPRRPPTTRRAVDVRTQRASPRLSSPSAPLRAARPVFFSPAQGNG